MVYLFAVEYTPLDHLKNDGLTTVKTTLQLTDPGNAENACCHRSYAFLRWFGIAVLVKFSKADLKWC